MLPTEILLSSIQIDSVSDIIMRQPVPHITGLVWLGKFGLLPLLSYVE